MSENETRIGDALRLLDTLREEEVKSFLETLINDDPEVLKMFLRRFGSIDLAGVKADLLYDLRKAEDDNSRYGDGFIDWYHADSFAYQVDRCVETHVDVLADRGDYESALALGFEVYLFLTQVDVDDSGGFTTDMVCVLDDTWDTIFEAAEARSDDGLFRLLYDKLNEYLTDETIRERAYSTYVEYDTYDFQCEHIEDYLVDHFSTVSSYASRIQETADQKIACALKTLKAREETNTRMGYATYGYDRLRQDIVRWMLVRMTCMKTLGASYQDLLAFAGDYLSEERVCLALVNERERAGDYAEALRLIGMRLDEAKGCGVSVPTWVLVRAIGLFEHVNDTAAVRNLLEQLVVSGASRNDAIEWFCKLRDMCPTDEWEELRETIFARVGNDHSRWCYYASEGLFERLMDEVEATGTCAFGDFEEELASRYPQRVLALFEKNLMGKGGNDPHVGNDRSAYNRFASRVHHLRSIEGGDEVADRIIQKVLALYPRRPALRDELRSA